jgi:crotonobetainyl-CoA:carnitine CoA-transferase CaiB-like acyl-CoA transferase
MSVPEKSFELGAACPLDGVRVIDMSRVVSGNMVSLQLADFGAKVLKIEDPKRGDPLHAWQTDGVSVHWEVYSCKKKSLAMSLCEACGCEFLLGLLDAGAQIASDRIPPQPVDLRVSLEGRFSVPTIHRPYFTY